MARRRFKLNIDRNSEFELDLAPLLAVMVKLVPVLLVSSAFVQLMIVETELPQVVQQALAREEKKEKPTVISLNIDKKQGMRIVTNKDGRESQVTIGLIDGNEFNYKALHDRIVEVKKENPGVFKIEFNPADNVSYKDIMRMMDEVRRAKAAEAAFNVYDDKTGTTTSTDYMFPEVVFANMTEG